MGNHKATEEQVEVVRSVVGSDFSEMDIIRALHMAHNDPAAAINIIFDTPHLRLPPSPSPPFSSKSPLSLHNINPSKSHKTTEHGPVKEEESSSCDRSGGPAGSNDWWFVGESEMAGLSTCKGRRINPGQRVTFSFPSPSINNNNSSPSTSTPKFAGKFRSLSSHSEIVRFSTEQHGEIGRIPNEWARCFVPLVRENKIMVDGYCKSAPEILGIVDTITLSISVHINISMLRAKSIHISAKANRTMTEESTFHPLPTLFRLLGLTPFKKAEFTPDDLYARKRPAGTLGSRVLPLEKCRKTSSDRSKVETDEESVSDSDLDKIIGATETSELNEMDPPDSLQCELRPYQKQALHWMIQIEKGTSSSSDAGRTLHPCWDAYLLSDKRGMVVYLNSFSGDASTEFPSTLQIARGGILADAMGLGKTIMTIALLLADSGKGWLLSNFNKEESDRNMSDQSQSVDASKKLKRNSCFAKLLSKPKSSLVGGGNLIVCPMTLLGQWKAEIEAHVKPGCINLYVHYGQSRAKESKFLAQSDIVLTTYGVLASEFSSENSEEKGGLYSVHWYRVILDEAHVIKSCKSEISIAASVLSADRRWCLTGTPIQNNLEDIYSLLRFLRIEPWKNWGLWNKLIQKPYEEGDERGLRLVQSILKPIMLRRTKSSTDKEGRPILVLPPVDAQVIYCELSETEKDFYEALFKRSKVKFDQFVEQGKVLHNYASILELLLRLRQCCDHPFLVLSRGDTQEYADLNKLANRLLKGKEMASNKLSGEPATATRAYVKEVVDELQKKKKGEFGDGGECAICLEAYEDAVLTPCAHCFCRECLFASWRSPSSGICPICRKMMSKQELITAPTESRFSIDVKKNWVESSKISFLLSELQILRSSGAKCIVFSQWTAFLDLLEIPLSRGNFVYVRLDGTLNQQQRERVIKEFAEDKNILVLLMSLKAGGVGINLTAASSAFLMDPWWNPAVEEQAVMRIHRIGQTNKVFIKRFIVKGTVEERMEAVQARKQRMISGALTDQEIRTARIEELKLLFS